jgi:hypothetical protein
LRLLRVATVYDGQSLSQERNFLGDLELLTVQVQSISRPPECLCGNRKRRWTSYGIIFWK